MLVPLLACEKFERHYYFQLINFEDPVYKRDFDIFHTVTISNFPQNAAEDKCESG